MFTLQHSKADMQAFYHDLKARVIAQGRAQEACLVLPSIDVIVIRRGVRVLIGVQP